MCKLKSLFIIPAFLAVASGLAGCGRKTQSVFTMPDGPVQSDLYVHPVNGIPDSFIRGMDASSVLAEENSGVVFYGFDGQEQDVLKTFAQAGVNYIRLRVWNDPFDKDGNGYGGGNNDVATAIALGKRATQYGMKVCIDFHYSDFWADPKRQHAPKAWQGMTIEQKCDALSAFTTESLTKILKAGVDVGMVQIGNEINNGMSGETTIIAVMKLLNAASSAVRATAKKNHADIKIAVHYTNIEDAAGIDRTAATLANFNVDYDIFGLSYYPFWGGPMENMQKVVRNLHEKHGKTVVLAETSYCYTSEDGDGFSNSLSGKGDIVDGYPATVQGQAAMVRDVIAAAWEAGASGVFYWEGSWIPVGATYEENAPIWEKYGSGWASSYSAEYDPDDAGLWYGGSSWDNQAFFDFSGHPLASINVFKYLKYGSTAPLATDAVSGVRTACNVGEKIELPPTVDVLYNDRSTVPVAVQWNKAQVDAIDTRVEGEYDIDGTTADGDSTSAHVSVLYINLLQNPGFESEDTSMWRVSYKGAANPTDFQHKTDDAHSGDVSLHFWSTDKMEFSVEQTVTDLAPGTYQLYAFAQGGDIINTAVMELYAITGGTEQTAPFLVTSWRDWKKPLIPQIKVTGAPLTVGIRITCNAKGWGTLDDFTLNRISD